MLDKEKLWVSINVHTPSWTPVEDKSEMMQKIATNLTIDDSVVTLILPRESSGDSVYITVECIYDPNNGNDEKYNEFFEKAQTYIENFNKKYKEKKNSL